jgi:hypothetical protein
MSSPSPSSSSRFSPIFTTSKTISPFSPINPPSSPCHLEALWTAVIETRTLSSPGRLIQVHLNRVEASLVFFFSPTGNAAGLFFPVCSLLCVNLHRRITTSISSARRHSSVCDTLRISCVSVCVRTTPKSASCLCQTRLIAGPQAARYLICSASPKHPFTWIAYPFASILFTPSHISSAGHRLLIGLFRCPEILLCC